MGTVSKRQVLVVSLISMLAIISIFPLIDTDTIELPSDLNDGPYVDHVVYELIENEDMRILALQNGQVDIIARNIDPAYLPILQASEDISLAWTLRNGYGHFTFNCRKYPMNISAFRRAFAYTFDKTRVTSEIFDGLSQEHDSVVPYVSDWCIEDELPYHYYTAQAALGNQILDDAGFTVDSDTGERFAPDNSHINITILYPDISPVIVAEVVQIGVDAFSELGINAMAMPIDFDDMLSLMDNNADFDMAFYAYDFHDYGVEWIASTFWGECADVPFENPSNFRNETFDSWRDQLLYGANYDDVYEAAKAMQLILHENVPIVVAYQNIFLQAYRTDFFAGYIEDVGRGIEGIWTLRKIHSIAGVSNGTVRIAIAEEPDTFNIFVNSNSYASACMEELWPSLYLRGPDLQPYPYLIEHLLTETHSDNSSVEIGRTRFTIDIVQNAVWNDGTPITAEDVAFTFKYLVESGTYGNPAIDSLTYLVAAYAPSTYRVVLEFETESYWHFSKFAYIYIIPKHIFNDGIGIGYAGWDSWDPVFYNGSLNVGSGPFRFSNYLAGDYFEIEANPNFWYYSGPWQTTPIIIVVPDPVIQYAIIGAFIVFSPIVVLILERRKQS